jgi:MFS family permease
MLMFSIAPFVGPSIGPLIGGFINHNVDWRWTHWTLLIWAGALWVAIVFFVPETYRKFWTGSKSGQHQLTLDCFRSHGAQKQSETNSERDRR